ncbi:MAG: arsenite methyltransferase [Salinirussus sp.]|jgi:arsenite methyltransferase
MSNTVDAEEQRQLVRERYAEIAREREGGCCDEGTDSTELGYDEADLDAAGGGDLGLGCGNPQALAGMTAGETVLDLGSGAGFDCLLAAREVSPTGRVIGVDMTPEMVDRARQNADDAPGEVEFRLGEIEHLPVADGVVDVVISNCVINLSPDKQQVFTEAFRALRPGGRLAVSDVVLTAALPDGVREDPESVAACVAGAEPVGELERMLVDTGFAAVDIQAKEDSATFIDEWDEDRDLSEYILSATVEARKPRD